MGSSKLRDDTDTKANSLPQLHNSQGRLRSSARSHDGSWIIPHCHQSLHALQLPYTGLLGLKNRVEARTTAWAHASVSASPLMLDSRSSCLYVFDLL
uniref:Uncharacterized protein n=1 Tax=Parascaris univalens TaxID=6257 RepID=A0A915A7L4_PARUN